MTQNPNIPPAPLADEPSGAAAHLGTAIARGIALFIGAFTLMNLLIELRHPGDAVGVSRYYSNLWWIDLSPLPSKAPLLEEAAMLFIAVTWLAYAVAPKMAAWRTRTVRTCIELLFVFIAWRILEYYIGLGRGKFHTAMAVPFAVFLAVLLWAVWRGSQSDRPRRGPEAWILMGITVAILAAVVPLLQIICFGLKDYRGSAEITVVFAASAAGPRDDVAARVKTAADLYRSDTGPVKGLMLLSGHSTEEVNAMRVVAIAQQVPEEVILVDPLGVDTESAVRSAQLILNKEFPQHLPMVLVVGHFYELPRLQMRFWREGRQVRTVPVPESIAEASKGMAGEIASLWKYYFESIVKP